MKNKHLAKKTLSVFMAVLMLMTCWVFVPGEHNIEAEAADATTAAGAYNLELLNSIPDFNRNITYFTDLNWAYNGDNQENESTVYQNILYSSDCNVATANTGSVNLKDSGATTIQWYHGATTFLYDGKTTPQTGVMLAVLPKGSSYNVRTYSSYISSGAGLDLSHLWYASDSRANFMWVISVPGNERAATKDGSVNSDNAWTVNSNTWLANKLQFTGSMSDTEFYRDITVTWGWKGNQKSQGTGSVYTYTATSGNHIYVINWEALEAAYTKAEDFIKNAKANPDKYSVASIKSLVDICTALRNAHPNNYVTSTSNNPSGYGTAASAAVNRINNFSFAAPDKDITFENLFSITDWANSKSFSYNTSAGEVTIESNKTIKIYKSSSGGELTTGSSYPGNHQAAMYSMPVTGGKDYTVRFNITSSVNGNVTPEVFLFWYDANNTPVNNTAGSATFNNKTFSGNGNHSVTFTAPATATRAEIRFDNDCPSSGSTLRFNDIAVYPAERDTAYGISNWTNRPYTKYYASGASVSGTLDVPERYGYEFDCWYNDVNANGVKDDGEEITDANGNVINSFAVDKHYNLYANWVPRTMDVGYDNLFSLSAWSLTDSVMPSNASRGNIVYDLEAGTITANTTKDGEVYSNYGTASNHYQIAVEPNTEYIFKADMHLDEGEKGQMFVFFYNASGAGVAGALYNGTAQTNTHIGIYPTTNGTQSITFTTPADCTQMTIRIGATAVGTTATYSNIGFFKKADYDAYAKNYEKVREPFKIGDTDVLMSPDRDGYVFDGWEKADGTKIETVNGLTENTIVYATWTKLYTVTYYGADNTTVLATVNVKDGETVVTLPSVVPDKESDAQNSYVFSNKWNANGAEFKADTVIRENVSVYPEFTSVPHSNFTYSLQKASTCTENARVIKKCADCSYNFGEVTYNPAEDNNADSHEAWLAKGHSYTGGILANSSTGNTDNDTHSLKCARYSTCGSVQLEKHVWANKGTDGATCTTPGTVHWSCACGAEKTTQGELAPDEHKFDLTTGTPNGDNETHTVKCTYNNAHTKSVACTDANNDCKCDICGQELVHVYDKQTKTYQKSAADCYNDAVYYYTCQCGKQGTETWTDAGSMLKHNWTDTEKYLKSDADCENDEVYYKECSLCNASSKDITGDTWTKTGTKSGHDYTSTIRNNNNGTHSYLCDNGCGTYGYNGVKEASTGCTYGEWTKTEADDHTKTCTECGYSVTEDHNWSDWESTDKNNNSEKGQHKRLCIVCGREETVDCTYTSVETKESCTKDGYTTHTCNFCSHKYITSGTKATGHNYTGEVKSYSNGQHNFLCVNGCETYGFDTIEGARTTCTYEYKNNKDGEHQATCTVCKYTFAQGCSGGQATCTAPAVCEKCETAYGVTAPHSFTGTVVKLDGDKHAYLCEYCSTEGLYGVGENQGATEDCSGGTATCTDLAVCTKCGDTHGELKADAHKWGEWENVAGTETHKRVCEYNNIHTETADCFSPDVTVIAPDCETAGYTINTCDICGHEWHTAPTEPLGHDWGTWVSDGAGKHTRICKDVTCKYGEDGGAKKQTVDCTKENADAVVTAPTCLDEGYTTYTCKDCGYVWVADYVDATGHSYTEKTKKTDSKYLRTTKDCVTDWTYWYCCDNCDVSAGTEADEYDDITVLYWVREEAVGHKYDKKTATEDYLATEATCTEKATYYYSCSVCGESSEGTDEEATFTNGQALDHDWADTEKFKKSDADCTKNEVYYKECSRCHISSENETGETWEKAETKTGHDFDHENGYTAPVAAKCLEAGVVEHWTCEVCGKKYTDENGENEISADDTVIGKLGHDYKLIPAKAATCEEDGYTKHSQCQRAECLYRNTDYKVIPAKGHDFKAKNGYYFDSELDYHAYKCSDCDAYGVDAVKWNAETKEGGIACTFSTDYENYDEEGKHYHKQSCVCGNVQSAECVDENGAEYTEPKCGANGYDTYVCKDCGYTWIVERENTALEHDFGTDEDWTKVEGKDEHIRYCKNGCGESETEACATENPVSGCGVQNVCDTCEGKFGKFTDHVWAEVEDEALLKATATCTTNAVYYKKCSNADCGKSSKDVDPTITWTKSGSKLGHDMVDRTFDISDWKFKPEGFDASVIVEPNCAREGKAIVYCTRCSEHSFRTVSKDTTNHVWDTDENGNENWVLVSGNCATGVTFKVTCTLCGKVRTKTEPTEHTFIIVHEELPTCEGEGYRQLRCSICQFVEEEYYNQATGEPADLAPLGHDVAEWTEGVASCKEFKYEYGICSRCEKTIVTEFEEKGEHTYKTVAAKKATCDIPGHNEYQLCEVCGIEDGKTVITVPHKDGDENGKCDECNRKLYNDGDTEKSCGCICHKENWLMKIIYKILNFFWKLFKISKSCECGAVHW